MCIVNIFYSILLAILLCVTFVLLYPRKLSFINSSTTVYRFSSPQTSPTRVSCNVQQGTLFFRRWARTLAHSERGACGGGLGLTERIRSRAHTQICAHRGYHSPAPSRPAPIPQQISSCPLLFFSEILQ